MAEILDDNFELRVRIDAMSNEARAIAAIADTWEFMTGAEMPKDSIARAREASLDARTPMSVWAEKLVYEATAKTRLSAHAQVINRDSVLRGDSRVLMDCLDILDFPEADMFFTELISQLGSAILDTAYKALGPNVDSVIEKYRAELTDDMTDHQKVVAMMSGYLSLLKRTGNGDNEDSVEDDAVEEVDLFIDETGRTVNHILKLSPFYLRDISGKKHIATCLGDSIILASYLQKCGVDALFHVGVVTPRHWSYSAFTHQIAESIDSYSSTHPVPYPDRLMQMTRKRSESADKIASDWDPHSAIIFNVGGQYVLCDLFQEMSIYLRPERSKKLLGEIADLQRNQPGLEVLYTPDEDLSHLEWARSIYSSYLDMLEGNMPSPRRWEQALHYAAISGEPQPLRDILDSITSDRAESFDHFVMSTGIVSSRLRAANFDSSLDGDEKLDELIAKMRDFTKLEADAFIKESLATQIFCLREYDEAEVAKCLVRCAEDEEYFRRRAEDLVLWPQRLMLAGMQRAWQDVSIGNETPIPHLALEVGEIKHRIGACALLDVSYGLGEELPLSFWTRQTSSQLPWLYSAQADGYREESITGREVSDRLRKVLEVLNWRYRQIVGII